MTRIKNKFLIYSFYRFIEVKNIQNVKKKMELFLNDKNMKGTILISQEGINGSLSGSEIDLLQSIKLLKTILKIRKLKIKVNFIDFLPFKRLKIRLKKEIVSLGKGKINVQKFSGAFSVISFCSGIIELQKK